MRRFELYPIGAALGLVRSEPRDAIGEAAVGGVPRVALRHDDEVRIELVFHVHGRAVPRDRLGQRHDLDARGLRLALPFDGLVVDPHTGDAGTDALPHEASHGHDAAVSGITVHDHGEAHALCDPAGDLDTLGHRRGAHVRETGVRTDDAARADERDLASRLFHDACVRGARRVQDDQHAIGAMNELLQSRALRPAGLAWHGDLLPPLRYPTNAWTLTSTAVAS